MRNLLITVCTLAMTVLVIGNAYVQKKQFYPSVVYITKSNPSMAVIYIQALIMIWLFGKMMQKLFFGELRAAEIEHLIEKFWYAITETCLAFTVFKDDFSPKFIALFALLLFLKTFHWLAEDRVDYMERSPVISWLFHARINFLLSLLGLIDLYFIAFAYHFTITKGASVQLVFGFEYAILLTVVVNTAIKYVLHMIDMNREVFWENKAVFLLYVEVFIGFIKVGLYVMFVILMIKLYTLPLFAFRPMYYSMRNFKKAVNDVIHSRRAIQNMNTLYPDATTEELAAVDNVCIICREEMQAGAKKLPCNHIFHVSCLRSWFQRHQTCPTCRLNVLRVTPENQNNVHAAPPQPQPVPPQNAGLPQLFPFAAWQPFMPGQNVPNAANVPRPAMSEQQPQATRSEAQTGAPPSASSNSSMDASAFSRQFQYSFWIPPMPAFMPGMPTPPMLPQNWDGLSLEELQQMEDTSRRAVEARLQTLRRINTMIDATVTLMQQCVMSASYSNATSADAFSSAFQYPASSSAPQNSASSSAPQNSVSSSAPSNSASNSAPPNCTGSSGSSTSANNGTEVPVGAVPSDTEVPVDSRHVSSEATTSQTTTPTEPSVSPSVPQETSSEKPEEENQNSKPSTSNTLSDSPTLPKITSSEVTTEAVSDEQEEIRRRRVEKFTSSS